MKRYIIYIEERTEDSETRIYFPCSADNAMHAKEQALDAYPNGTCITIFQEV